MFLQVIKKDLSITLSKKAKIFNLLFFFVLVISIFPFTLSPYDGSLKIVSSGVLWVALLLSSHISMQYIYEDDFEDGSLEQLFLTPDNKFLLILAKIIANFLSSSLIIVLFTPIAGLFYDLSTDHILGLVITMFIGGLTLNFLGSLAAAITVGIKKSSVISLALLIPFYIPTIIFGEISSNFAAISLSQHEFWVNFSLLLAIFLLICPVSVIASTYAVKAGIEE